MIYTKIKRLDSTTLQLIPIQKDSSQFNYFKCLIFDENSNREIIWKYSTTETLNITTTDLLQDDVVIKSNTLYNIYICFVNEREVLSGIIEDGEEITKYKYYTKVNKSIVTDSSGEFADFSDLILTENIPYNSYNNIVNFSGKINYTDISNISIEPLDTIYPNMTIVSNGKDYVQLTENHNVSTSDDVVDGQGALTETSYWIYALFIDNSFIKFGLCREDYLPIGYDSYMKIDFVLSIFDDSGTKKLYIFEEATIMNNTLVYGGWYDVVDNSLNNSVIVNATFTIGGENVERMGFRRIDDVVYLKGHPYRTNGTLGSINLFNLPVGFRVKDLAHRFPSLSGGSGCLVIDIYTTGNVNSVQAYGGATVYTMISHISFSTK